MAIDTNSDLWCSLRAVMADQLQKRADARKKIDGELPGDRLKKSLMAGQADHAISAIKLTTSLVYDEDGSGERGQAAAERLVREAEEQRSGW